MPKARKGDKVLKSNALTKPISGPYPQQRDGSRSNGTATHQVKSTVRAPKTLSLSEEILSQITKPVQPQSLVASDSNNIKSPSLRSPSSRPSKRKKTKASVDDALPVENAPSEQESTVEIKHSAFWQTCVPSEPAVYSSLIVNITKIVDDTNSTTMSSLPQPIVFRTLAFLTKVKAPIDASDRFPVSSMLCSASRFKFECQPSNDVDLTDPAKYSSVRSYTLKLMTMMSRLQKFEIPEAEMPYLLLPVKHNPPDTGDMLNTEATIDWEEVNAFATEDGRMLERDEVADVNRLQRIVNDGLWSYHYTDVSARFEVVALRQDLRASSEVVFPKGDKQTIHSLQPRKWKEALEAQGDDVWDDQPVFELEPSWDLHAMLRPTSSLRTRFIMPQILKKSHLSLSTYHSLFAVPALVQAIDFVLVAKELVQTYRLRNTTTRIAMEAISLPTAGLGTSYERLEWFGDSCCDVAAATYAYYAYVHHGRDMPDLQKLKEQLVVNQYQSEAAKRSGLVNYLRAAHVHAKHWIPLVVSSGQGSAYSFSNCSSVRVGVKTTADVLESVVGAFVLCNGFGKIFKTLRNLSVHFELPVKFKHLREIPLPVFQSQVNTGVLDEECRRLQRIVTYDFAEKRLVGLLLTPLSDSESDIDLRYLLYRLGSSIFHHLLAEWLYARQPEWDVSLLSEAHDFYNQPYQTAKIATKTGLENLFPAPSASQSGSADKAESSSRADVKHAWLLRQSEGTPNQRLDVGFKTLLAIIMIDNQWSWIDGPKKMFENLCCPILESVRLPDLKNMHPRQVLERLMRKRQCAALEVRKSKTDDGAMVEVLWHANKIGDATRSSKQSALEIASQMALDWYRDPANAAEVTATCQCSLTDSL